MAAEAGRHPRRRTGEIKHWQAVAVLAAAAFLFFKDILLGNAYLWEDFLYLAFPDRHFAAEALAHGKFPFWNPYIFNGMPFFAEIQAAVLYLPSLVLTFFFRNGSLSHYWPQLMVIAHYLLAGAGMYALALSFGLRRIPSLFAGMAFMLSSFMILHAIHVQIIGVVAWSPLILLFFRKALLEPGWLYPCLTALVLGHSILAGSPQLTVYLYFFLFTYFCYELFAAHRGQALLSRDAGRMVVHAGAAIILSIALAAVQLIPTIELGDLSQRATFSYEQSTQGQMSWSHLLTLIMPKFFGVADPSGYNYWGPGTYWYYWEDCMYRGALPLILFFLSILLWKKHRAIPFLWAFSLFGVLFALGSNTFIHPLMNRYLPEFGSFRCPARMLAFSGLAFALLSAFALDNLLYGDAKGSLHRNGKRLLFAMAGIVALLWVAVMAGLFDGTFTFLQNAKVGAYVRREASLSLVLFALSAALSLFLLTRRPARTWAVWGLFILTLFDLLLWGGSHNNSPVNPTDYFRRPVEIVRFFRTQGEHEYFRVNTRNEYGMIMDRNQGMMDHLFTMEGYTVLALKRVYPPVPADRKMDLLNVKFRTVSRDGGTLAIEPRTGYLPRAFMVYDYQVIHGEQELIRTLGDSTFNPARTALFERDPGVRLPRPGVTSAWKADIQSYSNDRIVLDVTTDGDGLLVLSEMYYPGWNATVDGTAATVHQTDYSLRSVFVPQGKHVVEFTFQPTGFMQSLLITLAALVVCAAGIAIPLTKRRSVPAPEH